MFKKDLNIFKVRLNSLEALKPSKKVEKRVEFNT